MQAQPQKEHEWLQKMVGKWTFEADAEMGPDKPPEKATGTESVRSLGGLWVVCEGEGEMPGGGLANTIMTLGYDPARNRFIGTWVGSMMTHMWIYEGQLDDSGNVLPMECEGPDFETEGKTKKYRDTIEIVNEDHRVLTSHVLQDDGTWNQFMRADYRRRK